MYATFEDWTNKRAIPTLGTNAGAQKLPFQGWRHFKEAFAPELVARAISESPIKVKRCLDPFGGSGTTALACQFLGIHPTTIEVNPFLADLIEAKLSSYKADSLASDLGFILRSARQRRHASRSRVAALPATFIEPGVENRWVFDEAVADRVFALIDATDTLSSKKHRRFFRMMIGGILIEVSNVIINGKGRRYRRGWEARCLNPQTVDHLFRQAAEQAIEEVHRFADRACGSFDLRRGDSRTALQHDIPTDIAIFSPPYPNSFDYTDVYNVELWTLGYLGNAADNRTLRTSTLCSHVQLSRAFPKAPPGSPKLQTTLRKLKQVREDLWDDRIPEMVAGYFGDMMQILTGVQKNLSQGGSLWMVVGDSRYANIQIETSKILTQLASQTGWKTGFVEPCRSMRSSAQQGGQPDLEETLVMLVRV